MSATGRGAPAQSATADREIVISRVISAPREVVFEAFSEVRHLSRWWGPEGFTTTTEAFEFRVGGEWDFVMHGPDGTDYQEWISWTEIPAGADRAPPRRVPRRPERLRVGPHVRAPRGGDPDRDAHRVPHQGAARRGGPEVPRDRGRRANPQPPRCLRHRDPWEGRLGLMATALGVSAMIGPIAARQPFRYAIESIMKESPCPARASTT